MVRVNPNGQNENFLILRVNRQASQQTARPIRARLGLGPPSEAGGHLNGRVGTLRLSGSWPIPVSGQRGKALLTMPTASATAEHAAAVVATSRGQHPIRPSFGCWLGLGTAAKAGVGRSRARWSQCSRQQPSTPSARTAPFVTLSPKQFRRRCHASVVRRNALACRGVHHLRLRSCCA